MFKFAVFRIVRHLRAFETPFLVFCLVAWYVFIIYLILLEAVLIFYKRKPRGTY